MYKEDQGRSKSTRTHLDSNVSMFISCDIMTLIADTSSESYCKPVVWTEGKRSLHA